MKRKTIKSVVCAALMAVTLSMTACGNNAAGNGTESGSRQESQTEGYSTLEDYYNDPSVKSVLDSSFSSLGGEGLSVAIDVVKDEFILTVKYEDSALIVEGMEDALEQALDAAASQFETQVDAFNQAIGKDTCTVTVRYVDPSDNVLAERTFPAK